MSQAELELLVAGDIASNEARDFDMRNIRRIEKNKNKSFRGSRKRKEDAVRSANIASINFEVDTTDDRFKSVLDGEDDRFGIDPTNPSYKETPAMRTILKEQSRRRKNKRQRKSANSKLVADVNADAELSKAFKPSEGAAALSTLVSNLKRHHG